MRSRGRIRRPAQQPSLLLFFGACPLQQELWVLPMDGEGAHNPVPFLRTEFSERVARAKRRGNTGRFSPDGHWIAYESTESGQREIYVLPFPVPADGGGKSMVSQGGGAEPRWRRDGKELFYVSPEGQVMASQVSVNGATFQPGIPRALFKAQFVVGGVDRILQAWDVSADGTKLLSQLCGARRSRHLSPWF